MRHFSQILLCLTAVGCATAGQNLPADKIEDPEASASLEQFLRDGFTAADKGDFSYWSNSACPDALMWDVDEKGVPFAAKGKEAVKAAMDGFAKMIQDSHGSMKSDLTNLFCRSSTNVGFCAVEFSQVMTMNGQAMPAMKFRGTAVARRFQDKWIWTHWHASMNEAPAPATAAAAVPAAQAPAAAQP